MSRWTGLAPWEFESPFPGSLTSTFLGIPPAATMWDVYGPRVSNREELGAEGRAEGRQPREHLLVQRPAEPFVRYLFFFFFSSLLLSSLELSDTQSL